MLLNNLDSLSPGADLINFIVQKLIGRFDGSVKVLSCLYKTGIKKLGFGKGGRVFKSLHCRFVFVTVSISKLRNSSCPVPHVVKMSKVAMESNDKVDILQLNNFGNCET